MTRNFQESTIPDKRGDILLHKPRNCRLLEMLLSVGVVDISNYNNKITFIAPTAWKPSSEEHQYKGVNRSQSQ